MICDNCFMLGVWCFHEKDLSDGLGGCYMSGKADATDCKHFLSNEDAYKDIDGGHG